jgi:hypothetical protein
MFIVHTLANFKTLNGATFFNNPVFKRLKKRLGQMHQPSDEELAAMDGKTVPWSMLNVSFAPGVKVPPAPKMTGPHE